MPKVDNSILSSKDKIVSDLENIIDPKNVLSHPDELRPFETDGLTAYRKMPMAVVMPETVEEVSKILKYCNENKIKVINYLHIDVSLLIINFCLKILWFIVTV